LRKIGQGKKKRSSPLIKDIERLRVWLMWSSALYHGYGIDFS